jgi:hypothetical protein
MAARGSFAGRDWAVGEPAGRPVARGHRSSFVGWRSWRGRALASRWSGWPICLTDRVHAWTDRSAVASRCVCGAARRDAEHAPVLAAELRGAVVEPTAKPTPATSPGPVEQTAGGRVRNDMIISPRRRSTRPRSGPRKAHSQTGPASDGAYPGPPTGPRGTSCPAKKEMFSSPEMNMYCVRVERALSSTKSPWRRVPPSPSASISSKDSSCVGSALRACATMSFAISSGVRAPTCAVLSVSAPAAPADRPTGRERSGRLPDGAPLR